MPALLGVQAKRVGEAPVFDVLKRGLFGLAEQNPVLPELRIVYVALFRRDIKVSTKQDLCLRIVILIEPLSQPLHPLQFELIFVGAHDLSVCIINIDDADAGYISAEQTGVAFGGVFRKTADGVSASVASEAGAPVIALLAKQHAVITG